MNRNKIVLLALAVAGVGVAATIAQEGRPGVKSRGRSGRSPRPGDEADANAALLLAEGRDTFRYDTFGDEEFWGGKLELHDAIKGAALGGVGGGLSPRAALALGLKVDVDALTPAVIAGLTAGTLDLDDPANTVELLRLNSVLGLTGFFAADASLDSIGIQCALCHSTVDDSLAVGIGRRRDGWAARDLDVGQIIALAPTVKPFADILAISEPTVRDVLKSWGPGKFDAALVLDGKAFRKDGLSGATLIPPAFGLAGMNLHTWTGWGSVTHWNAFVANLEMHGKGTFFDPRLDNVLQFPIAARNGFGHITSDEDRITPKLPGLQLYQLALPAPVPPIGSFDPAAARRGDALFSGAARCSECHTDGAGSEPGWNMHRANEIGIDEFQSDRSPDRKYRTAPLDGLWTHVTGGFYHDGRFATLLDVVDHYDAFFSLGLAAGEKDDIVQYLLSLPDGT